MSHLDQPLSAQSSDKDLDNRTPEGLINQSFFQKANFVPNGAAGTNDHQGGGLPNLELIEQDRYRSPWLQPAKVHSGLDVLKKVVHNDDTVAAKLHGQELKELSPAQRRQYDREEDAKKDYEARASLNSGPMPPCPMHDRINAKVAADERQIERQVKGHMTADERTELDRELKNMDMQYREWKRHSNPLGTGNVGPHIKAGPAVEDYFDRIKRVVENRG